MFTPFDNDMESLQISDQKYNLRWPDYHNSVLSSFRSLKEEEDFIDVTLSCEERQYSAHKVVLSACSPYFRKLLKSNPCSHPIVILRDVREEDLRLLLNFMYQGEVQVDQERISTFLRTAETLQIKGLADHPLKEQCQKTSSTSLLPLPEQQDAADYSPLLKRPRHSTGPNSSPLPCRQSPTEGPRHNGEREREPWLRPTSPKLEHENKYESMQNGDNKSLLSQALEKREQTREERDDSASDTTGSERAGSASIDTVKSDMNSRDGDPPSAPIFPPGLEALYRQAGFPPFLSLGGGHHIPPPHPQPPQGPSTTHIGLQSHAANPTISGMLSDLTATVSVGGKLEMMRVRATDPRPCPRCGKIYRSAHTLRTHMEDKHTVCTGYRCVLCGTVAKSRNSLHSHMSRQHRGISTKDLPVLPMPSPFDPELASKLLNKAGVKVSPSELAARASPTAPRRSDLPKLDNNLSIHSHNQFPLPPSLPPHHLSLNREQNREMHNSSDPEDLRIPSSSPFSSSQHFSPPSSHTINSLANAGMKPPGVFGGSIVDTYLSMIAGAEGGNLAAAAAALSFQNTPAARAAMAAAQLSAAGMMPHNINGKEERYGSDRGDDDGELGSDAENEDMSDNEEMASSTPVAVSVNNGESN